eukprot:403355512
MGSSQINTNRIMEIQESPNNQTHSQENYGSQVKSPIIIEKLKSKYQDKLAYNFPSDLFTNTPQTYKKQSQIKEGQIGNNLQQQNHQLVETSKKLYYDYKDQSNQQQYQIQQNYQDLNEDDDDISISIEFISKNGDDTDLENSNKSSIAKRFEEAGNKQLENQQNQYQNYSIHNKSTTSYVNIGDTTDISPIPERLPSFIEKQTNEKLNFQQNNLGQNYQEGFNIDNEETFYLENLQQISLTNKILLNNQNKKRTNEVKKQIPTRESNRWANQKIKKRHNIDQKFTSSNYLIDCNAFEKKRMTLDIKAMNEDLGDNQITFQRQDQIQANTVNSASQRELINQNTLQTAQTIKLSDIIQKYQYHPPQFNSQEQIDQTLRQNQACRSQFQQSQPSNLDKERFYEKQVFEEFKNNRKFSDCDLDEFLNQRECKQEQDTSSKSVCRPYQNPYKINNNQTLAQKDVECQNISKLKDNKSKKIELSNRQQSLERRSARGVKSINKLNKLTSSSFVDRRNTIDHKTYSIQDTNNEPNSDQLEQNNSSAQNQNALSYQVSGRTSKLTIFESSRNSVQTVQINTNTSQSSGLNSNRAKSKLLKHLETYSQISSTISGQNNSNQNANNSVQVIQRQKQQKDLYLQREKLMKSIMNQTLTSGNINS